MMTTTPEGPTTERIVERLAQLQQQRDAIPALGSRPLSMTHDESVALDAEAARIDRLIAALRTAVAAVAALGSAEADERWRDVLTSARAVLCEELLSIKSPIRDAITMGRSINLTLSIKSVDFGLGVIEKSGYALTTLRLGELMREAGYEVTGADSDRNYVGVMPWHGSLPDVEKRIADRAQRRIKAQAALDDALMDDDERAKREAESKARLDALNALPQRKTRWDGSQYDKYPDGRRVEVTS